MESTGNVVTNTCLHVLGVALLGLATVSARAEETPGLAPKAQGDHLLLQDDFSGLKPGQFSSLVGAHTEYHYLPSSAPKGSWVVSSFTSRIGFQRAWKVFAVDGDATLAQIFDNVKTPHAHPMVVAGDPLWRDYTLTVRFVPESSHARSGIVFRYRNDRCYYFFGVDGSEAVLKFVQHGTAFRRPLEKLLASAPFQWTAGTQLTAQVRLDGANLEASFAGGPTLTARDTTYSTGRIGLVADVPTRFHQVTVTADATEGARVLAAVRARETELRELQAAHPQPVLWKRFNTEGVRRRPQLAFR
jgi:rhamnogalacturonan endolyase